MEYHSGGSLPLLGRPRYCPGANANGGYLCETGHCCGETGCCTYYYELWWFWLLWTVLIVFSCCCAYRHRRAKLRVQQQQRQRDISLLAYHGASSYRSSMLDLSFLASLKLPSYEEVAAQPSTPPPPYSSVFTTPRYPQPPRATDPHLLAQHDPLLHRPLSDSPSSLSSDNSSSCSCDSCCPSSPCSSSLSVPVTYETDTSHASTPSGVASLTLEVTLENTAAASDPVRETGATDSSFSDQTVTVAVVARATSQELLPSASSDVAPPVGTPSPKQQQLNSAPCYSTCSLSTHSTLMIVSTTVPPTLLKSSEGTTEGPSMIPTTTLKTTSMKGLSTPKASTCNSPSATHTPEIFNLTRKIDTYNIVSTITSVLIPDVGIQTNDCTPSLVPSPAPSNVAQSSIPVPIDCTQAPDTVPSNLTLVPDPPPKPTIIPESATLSHLALVALTPCQNPELSPGSDVAVASPSTILSSPQHPEVVTVLVSSLHLAAVPVISSPSLVLSRSPESDLTSQVQSDVLAGVGTGSYSLGSPAPVLTFPTPGSTSPCSSCPAINIESAFPFTNFHSSPVALHPSSSPTSLPCPPAPSSASLSAAVLFLDPLTALNQSGKDGFSAHASSLSPSPRATLSPPKQTLFSPCVDFFEAEPSSWKEVEDEHEQEDNEDDEEEDMGADESQYRHRRLTGDSGIEVCRCRVEDEEEEEEEQESKSDDRRGGEKEIDGGVKTDLHDSVDCCARGQTTTEEGITLCNPTSTPTQTSEDSGEVVILMEKV